MDYIDTLKDELEFSKKRLKSCELEAEPVIRKNIRYIENEIHEILRKNEHKHDHLSG